jgi:hypothetical protein
VVPHGVCAEDAGRYDHLVDRRLLDIATLTPFAVDWDAVSLDVISGFLNQPVEESLTWEAKGGTIKPDDIRVSASAFGNSDLGGFLVLGATQDHGLRSWTLDGWQPPEVDVGQWVAKCLDHVRPRPEAETKSFALSSGGVLAVVRFLPAPIPPVITSAGLVWQRVDASRSIRVTDPAALRRLFDRGTAAEVRIHDESHAAVDELFGSGPNGRRAVVMAAAAASLPSDITGRVFRRSFASLLGDRVVALHRATIGSNLEGFVQAHLDGGQGWVGAYTTMAIARDFRFDIRMRRHGGVSVGLTLGDVDDGISWVTGTMGVLQQMYDAIATVLAALGAHGPTLLAARFSAGEMGSFAADHPSDTRSDGQTELGRIYRDVARGARLDEWEPEPDD